MIIYSIATLKENLIKYKNDEKIINEIYTEFFLHNENKELDEIFSDNDSLEKRYNEIQHKLNNISFSFKEDIKFMNKLSLKIMHRIIKFTVSKEVPNILESGSTTEYSFSSSYEACKRLYKEKNCNRFDVYISTHYKIGNERKVYLFTRDNKNKNIFKYDDYLKYDVEKDTIIRGK